jgi:uncharacterized membrane protein
VISQDRGWEIALSRIDECGYREQSRLAQAKEEDMTNDDTALAGGSAKVKTGFPDKQPTGKSQMNSRQIVIGFLLAIFASLWTLPASAGLFVCNDSGVSVNVAVAWSENDGWASKGWWIVPPRECTLPIEGPLENRYYYYYIRSNDGNVTWSGGPGAGFFCVNKTKRFYYSQAAGCDGYSFSRVDVGEARQYTFRIKESDPNPRQAALNCADKVADGRDAFAKCWMRNVASNKQRHILDCWDRTGTYTSFAICAKEDELNPDAIKIADCAANYAEKRIGSEFLTCVSKGQMTAEQARVFDCAVNNQGSYAEMGTCAVGGLLTPEQRRIYDCVARNNGYQNMGLCAAATQLTPEQSRLANCVLSNRGSYTQMGVCAVGGGLTPEQQVFVQCAVTSGGQPYAYAGCVGTQLTVNELQKCFTQGVGGNGCFGENNTFVRDIRNALKDVSQGPGPNNDLVGRDGFVMRNVAPAVAWTGVDLGAIAEHGPLGGDNSEARKGCNAVAGIFGGRC